MKRDEQKRGQGCTGDGIVCSACVCVLCITNYFIKVLLQLFFYLCLYKKYL